MTGFTLTLAHDNPRQPEPDAILDAHSLMKWTVENGQWVRRCFNLTRTAKGRSDVRVAEAETRRTE